MNGFNVETRKAGDVAHLVLTGELDLACVPLLEDELRAVEAESPAVVIIDLTDVQFMDSSGLRSLVMADERARVKERRLAIVPGPPMVKRVFEITKLDQRLDLVETAAAVSRPGS